MKQSKYTNEYVDLTLQEMGLQIKRLGDLSGLKDPANQSLSFQCLICDYGINGEWTPIVRGVLRGKSSCQQCSGFRLTNKTVDERLEGRTVKRLGDIIKGERRTTFQCLECGYGKDGEWATYIDSILRGQGCPPCGIKRAADGRMISNEEVDERLRGRNIKRLGNSKGAREKIEVQCAVAECGYIWSPTVDNLSHGHGCPNCAELAPWTNDRIDKALEGRNIKRLGDCDGGNTKIAFQCTIEDCLYGSDGKEWMPAPSWILTGDKTGCPMCAGNAPLTNERIDKRLEGRNILRVGDCGGTDTPIEFACLIQGCEYHWKTKPDHITNSGSGCPNCSGLARITNEMFDKRIGARKIKRLGDCAGATTKVELQCMQCEHIWKTTPSSIFTGHGCPICSLGKSQRIVFDVLKEANIVFNAEEYLTDIYIVDSRYHIDFYLPQHNTIIEYNGEQHYMPVCFGGISKERAEYNFITYQQPRDAFVRDFCAQHNINLIIIDGRTYTNNKLKDYILNEIIPSLTLKTG